MTIKLTALPNGIKVFTDSIEGFESASIGIFVNVGSVDEKSGQEGLSHFLEHMAFKGTKTRSALQISSAIESVGGFINAYTGKEITAYHTKVLKKDVKLSIDILSDILLNSVFDKDEFEKERGVIIQEIRQVNDSPDDLVFDLFQEQAFKNTRLGTSILGSEERIQSYTTSDLENYIKSKYATNRLIICASGAVDHNEIVEYAEKYTAGFSNFDVPIVEKQTYSGGVVSKAKDLEQVHYIAGYEGVSHTDNNKYDLCVLSAIIGGGMSSRLFQQIREKRGLVYSIFSFVSNYRDTGTFGYYAACAPEKAKDVMLYSNEEIDNILKNGVTREELERAKNQLKASLLMGLESSSTRMERMASQYFYHGRIMDMTEVAKNIDAVNQDSIKHIAEKILTTNNTTTAIVGPKDEINNILQEAV
ncbi:MAG: insulinase family protein [Alphaproteobacteria bacterium]|nr:insulinase family protein [Alphaproteobacteria bacterium]